MYFEQFKPASSVMPGPTGHLKSQIEKQWGSLQAFQDEFTAKGVSLFGSGWVWLSAQEDGTLVITQEPGASNPVCHVMPGSTGHPGHLKPLLTFDVWEHAYYLDWQNRRGDQLKALWGILDWRVLAERYNTQF
jgi:Fe-Mn family superoxide dismutase